MVKFFPMWRVHEVVSEYGMHGKLVGDFTTKEQAEQFAKGKGYYGGEGDVKEYMAVEIDGHIYLLADPDPVVPDGDLIDRENNIRIAALAKLTPEDKRVLGLKDA